MWAVINAQALTIQAKEQFEFSPLTLQVPVKLKTAVPDPCSLKVVECATKGKKTLLMQSIAKLEGFYKHGTLAQRQNNPGNLRFAKQVGAVKGDKGFAKFSTLEQGWNALRAQIALDAKRGHTLETFIHKYAPPHENNTKRYLSNLSISLNVSQSIKLSHILWKE